MTIVNGVDTDQIRRAAQVVREDGSDVTVTLPSRSVAAWLDATAAEIEASRPGEQVLGLMLAGTIARTAIKQGRLPAWDEMTDLDKGAALMHLHKREWEGEGYAVENYPAKYHDHPALVALSSQHASEHAAGLKDVAEALDPAEHDRLYELAMAAERG